MSPYLERSSKNHHKVDPSAALVSSRRDLALCETSGLFLVQYPDHVS